MIDKNKEFILNFVKVESILNLPFIYDLKKVKNYSLRFPCLLLSQGIGSSCFSLTDDNYFNQTDVVAERGLYIVLPSSKYALYTETINETVLKTLNDTLIFYQASPVLLSELYIGSNSYFNKWRSKIHIKSNF